MAQVDPTQGIRHFDSISKGLDIGSVMMMVNLERATIMESQVMDQAQRMKNINEDIRTAQHFMSEARKFENGGGWWGDAATFTRSCGTVWNMKAFAQSANIDVEEEHRDASMWKVVVEKIKQRVDSLNSNSQLEMIKLQSLINKRNQAFEMSSNHVNKFSGTLDKIISNMR